MTKILVVDDEAPVRQTVRDILERAQFAVEEAADVETALTLSASAQPELIVTDILMPDHDGLELILQLREASPATRILAMSGGGLMDPSKLLIIAKALGADDYIAKPFGKAALIEKVQSCLRVAR